MDVWQRQPSANFCSDTLDDAAAKANELAAVCQLLDLSCELSPQADTHSVVLTIFDPVGVLADLRRGLHGDEQGILDPDRIACFISCAQQTRSLLAREVRLH